MSFYVTKSLFVIIFLLLADLESRESITKIVETLDHKLDHCFSFKILPVRAKANQALRTGLDLMWPRKLERSILCAFLIDEAFQRSRSNLRSSANLAYSPGSTVEHREAHQQRAFTAVGQ